MPRPRRPYPRGKHPRHVFLPKTFLWSSETQPKGAIVDKTFKTQIESRHCKSKVHQGLSELLGALHPLLKTANNTANVNMCFILCLK